MKICRISTIQTDLCVDAELTDKSIELRKWADEYYDINPRFHRSNMIFLRSGNEFVWKFEDLGPAGVVYPMDRLPKGLEDYLIEKVKGSHCRTIEGDPSPISICSSSCGSSL